jgi:hypothetical protein
MYNILKGPMDVLSKNCNLYAERGGKHTALQQLHLINT